MQHSFSSQFPRLWRITVPVVVGGSCAVLLLALLAGFVPGREGGELRLPLNLSRSSAFEIEKPATRPLDTSVWMVRMPLEHMPVAPAAYMLGDDDAIIGFSSRGVSFLTTDGPRLVSAQAGQHELFQQLNREARGVPNGLTLNHSATVAGNAMPWCVPAPSRVPSLGPSSVRNAWLRGRVMPYRDIVNIYVGRFELNRDLVYAIMYTESGFNPMALSTMNAHGLMQVVPSTAGMEVYAYLHDTPGKPSSADLFNPATNIQYGMTYLHLLMQRHLAGIKNPLAREYCAVAAYNTGPGSVLKIFGRTREAAFEAINKASPSEVYDILQERLVFEETRDYVRKVMSLKNGFRLASR